MSFQSNIIAIGDIHGCHKTCEAMLTQLHAEYETEPFYVFLGDYTDRGPNSRRVVEQMLEFEKDHECIFIRGNHDQMLLDAHEKGEWDLWLANGGNTTLRDYDSRPGALNLPETHHQFFSDTKLYWETEDYFFVHGGLNPDLTIAENLERRREREEFVWQRGHIRARQNKWEKTVVFGHTPVEKPLIREHMIGIDTGCVYNKHGLAKLTAVVLPEQKFIQQKSLDA